MNKQSEAQGRAVIKRMNNARKPLTFFVGIQRTRNFRFPKTKGVRLMVGLLRVASLHFSVFRIRSHYVATPICHYLPHIHK